MANPFSLEGKVALVTGANTGLGQGIAIALAEAGADIAAVGIAPPTETEAKVRALGRRFVAIEANLSSVEPIDRIVRETIDGLGGLRHPGQQRRPDPSRRRGGLQREGLGRRDERQPQGARSSWRRPQAAT